jgi:hypothetical protein
MWRDDDRVHFWAADGVDNWQETGWIEDVQSTTKGEGEVRFSLPRSLPMWPHVAILVKWRPVFAS